MDNASTPGSTLSEIDLELLESQVTDALGPRQADTAFLLIGKDLLDRHEPDERRHLPPAVAAALPPDFLERSVGPNALQPDLRSTGGTVEGVGKSFWELYRARLRTSLCEKDGALFKLTMRDGTVSTKAVITALASSLGVGSAFAGLLCGLTIILLDIGLTTFCEWSSPDTDGGSPQAKDTCDQEEGTTQAPTLASQELQNDHATTRRAPG